MVFTWKLNGKVFSGINITLFLKNKHIFEENLYYGMFGNTFQ